MKTRKDKVGDLVELVQELLLTRRLDNQEGFKQMLLENESGTGVKSVVCNYFGLQKPVKMLCD